MILAAAAFSDGKGPPPDELQLYLECRKWRRLPRAGGILDQPAGLLQRMNACWEATQAVRAYGERKPGTDAAWKQAHPNEWAWVKQVRELRQRHGTKTRHHR
jgi:hypothetical protein